MALTRCVALIRGINVGGRNKVSMADLRGAFEDAGYRSVTTYIQSGNVLFESDRPSGSLESDLETALERRLGIPLVVVVRSHRQLRNVVDKAPKGFGNPETHHSDVLFLKGPLTSRQAMKVVQLADEVDQAWPGTGVLYTVAAGLSRGSRASIVAAVGCTLGIVPHMAAAITGLAALLHTSAVAFQTLKYLGVVYLLYMAWSTVREKGALSVRSDSGPRSATQVIVSGVLINILNPKLSIFFLAFLPQFVSTEEARPLASMLMLSGVFMLMTFVVFVGYGLLAASIRDHVISRPRVLTWMRRTFAAAFVALGAKLAVADR